MSQSSYRLLHPVHFLLIAALSMSVAHLCAARTHAVSNGSFSNDDKHDKAQREKPYALIFGTVWSPDNRPVYGVKIRCRRADEKKVRWERYSDHHGEFAIRVPAGKADYLLWPDLKDFKSLEGKKFQAPPEVTIHIENDERTDIGVHLR